MAFNEIGFLFLFLPAVLLLHQVMPKAGKNILLLLASLLFFAWGSAQYVLLMLLLILFNYLSGMLIAEKKAEGGNAKLTLITTVAADLLLLGFFKYWGFVIANINALLKTSLSAPQAAMPIGISFFTFSILSYLFDVYRDKAPATENLMEFALYVTFFPKLVSGPIVRYTAIADQLHDRKCNAVKFGKGARLFLIGLAKKVLLANTLGTTFYAVLALEEVSVVTAWLGTITYSLMLYFDFGGYSDMAIGLGQMFGFSFDNNFDYPYLSSSITEFWRRWHISLGAWFRDYVYIPLGGSRQGQKATIRNLMIVWLLTGLWHGASWNFVFWGLYYGILLILEKFVFQKFLEHVPGLFKHVFTLIFVMIGWVFFFSPSLGFAFSWLGKMFGIGSAGVMDSTAWYYFDSSWKILLIATVSAFPVVTKLVNSLMKRSEIPAYVTAVCFAVLMVFIIAAMVSGTYSSFLYFQF